MMKNLVGLCLAVFFTGSTHAGLLSEFWESLPGTYQKLQQIKSPDGHAVAVLFHKERHAWKLSLEPAAPLERWARLNLIKDGKKVYDSGDENLNIYQRQPGFALDLAWSPDSAHVAYRFINSVRIIGSDGKVAAQDFAPVDAMVSSFRWNDNASLLIVSKKTELPLNVSGKPYLYNAYTDSSKELRITRWHLTQGYTKRYRQAWHNPPFLFHNPTFLFHSVGFCAEEISPGADRVAFSDGVDLCVYDDATGKVIARCKIPQKPTALVETPNVDERTRQSLLKFEARPDQLDGIWWPTNTKLVVGLELLGRPKKRAFYTFDIVTQELVDVTSTLLPIWQTYYQKTHGRAGVNRFGWEAPDWYRSAIK